MAVLTKAARAELELLNKQPVTVPESKQLKIKADLQHALAAHKKRGEEAIENHMAAKAKLEQQLEAIKLQLQDLNDAAMARNAVDAKLAVEIQTAIDNAAADDGSSTGCPESVATNFSLVDSQKLGAMLNTILADVLSDTKYSNNQSQVKELMADIVLQFNYKVGQATPVEDEDLDMAAEEADAATFPAGF